MARPLRECALFAGAGGGLLAGRLLGWQTVRAVELNPYRRQVLLRRQWDGLLDVFPIWDDIGTFDGRPWRGAVDLLTAGFPCQPFSQAGRRRGADDPKNQWPGTSRIIREVEPPLAFLENTPGLLADRYFGAILGELAESGYDTWWDCVPASSFGANHQRDRLWILAVRRGSSDAHSHLVRIKRQWTGQQPGEPWSAELGDDGETWTVANRDGGRQPGKPAGDTVRSCVHRDADQVGLDRSAEGGEAEARTIAHSCRAGCDASNAHGQRLDRWRTDEEAQEPSGLGTTQGAGDWWSPQSRVPLVAHGVASRVERIASTGDGQVPVVAAGAFIHLALVALEALEDGDHRGGQ